MQRPGGGESAPQTAETSKGIEKVGLCRLALPVRLGSLGAVAPSRADPVVNPVLCPRLVNGGAAVAAQ